MRFLRSKRGAVAAGVVLLLAMFLVRPGANRLRARIVSSISLALGRPVEVSSVSLRLLPQPGFELENFVVHDDPAFSLEPVVRASEVTAVLRVSSLLRGKLEIASLSLSEPSLNLVRDSRGQWNIQTLVERAAQIPVAPTAKARGEVRPGFPYIEADGGRINFKFGQEKKPYALTDADFAVWQDSDNTWGMRLKAQPMRTDFNLSDTGELRVNGTWQRASSLRDTPLQFNLLWERGQLGQVSKLAYGNDQGWRGAVQVSSLLTGTPANLKITGAASVEDFRRYDVMGGPFMRLRAQCSGRYSSVDHRLFDLACNAPVGNGKLALEGSLTGLLEPHAYSLMMTARDVPVQSLVSLARRTGKNIPAEVIAAGKVEARLKLFRAGDSSQGASLEGGGEATGVRLGSGQIRPEMALAAVHFAVARDAASGQPLIELTPFNLNLGRPVPVVVRGRLERSGYTLQLRGEAQLHRLLQAARTVGLPAPAVTADGVARVDLQISGGWNGAAVPQSTGKAQIRAVRADIVGLNTPLEIASADLSLLGDEVKATDVSASLGDSSWHGSLVVPRHCAREDQCPVRFSFAAAALDTGSLARLVTPDPKQPWYRFLSGSAKPRVLFLAGLRAGGRLSIGHLTIHGFSANRVSADIELASAKLRLSNVRADVLGGTHHGEWTADFAAQPPAYSGSGDFEHVALGKLSEAMHDPWASGTASATFEVKAMGSTFPQVLSSANGNFQVEAHDAALPHVILAGLGSHLRFDAFAASLDLHDGSVEVREGKLETPQGIYLVTGTATLARTWNLQLMRDGTHGFSITGSLATPHVEQVAPPVTRASLKP